MRQAAGLQQNRMRGGPRAAARLRCAPAGVALGWYAPLASHIGPHCAGPSGVATRREVIPVPRTVDRGPRVLAFRLSDPGIPIIIRDHAQSPFSAWLPGDGGWHGWSAAHAQPPVAFSVCRGAPGRGGGLDDLGAHHFWPPQLSCSRKSHGGRACHHRTVSVYPPPYLHGSLPVRRARSPRQLVLVIRLAGRFGCGLRSLQDVLRRKAAGGAVSRISAIRGYDAADGPVCILTRGWPFTWRAHRQRLVERRGGARSRRCCRDRHVAP